MKGSKRTLEELRWEMMGSLQNLRRAASLCAWCIKVVEEILLVANSSSKIMVLAACSSILATSSIAATPLVVH